MEGWLQKKGHIFSTWKKRFFLLEDRSLKYYETDDLKKKKGEYVLDADSRVVVSASNPLSFTLYAIGSGGQELDLLAANLQEVEAWKHAFENAKEVFIAEDTQRQNSMMNSGAQAEVKVKGAVGGTKVISSLHKLDDIGLSPNLKLSHEMQITFNVLAMKEGTVLQYDAPVKPASDEHSCTPEEYLHGFEIASRPAVEYEAPEWEYFTLLLVDPDYPSVTSPMFRERVLWAVVNIPEDAVVRGTVVCPYKAPAPHYNSGAHRYVFILCRQGRHLVCAQTASVFFQHRSPLRSASFIAQTPLFAATSGHLESLKLDKTSRLADLSIVKEVSQRMSIDAVSVFYCEWDASMDLIHVMDGDESPETRQFPSPAQSLMGRLPSHDAASMMLLGSLVAEAASTGVEWIYDQDQLAQRVADAQDSLACLVFCDPPMCPFFAYPAGRSGFYHEQVQCFRRSLVLSGEVCAEDQANAYNAFYKDVLSKNRANATDISEKYIDTLTKTFLRNFQDGKPVGECGINQFEAQSLTKVPTLVARYNEDTLTLLSEVRKMVNIWQSGEGALISTEFCTLMARMLDYTLSTRRPPRCTLQHFIDRAHDQAKETQFKSAWDLTPGELNILHSVEVLESKLLLKIQDIASVLALSTKASDRQKLRIQTTLTRALFVNGTGDGTDAHFRNVIAGVTLEAVDKDLWDSCKALAKESKWSSTAQSELRPADVAKLLGNSCDVHGTFFNVCYLMKKCSSYQEAVQLNVLLSGDCCSRSVLLGAFFAAPVYPLPERKTLLHFCANQEAPRAFSGDQDHDTVSVLTRDSSWIPIDWLLKCDPSSLAEVITDSEVLEVARSEVLLIGEVSARITRAMKSALAGGQPRVRVVIATLSKPETFRDLINSKTRSILLMPGELSEEPTEELLCAIKALEACLGEKDSPAAHIVLMSSTAIDHATTSYGQHFSCVEQYLEASGLSSTAVRTPWMMESVFDQMKRVLQGNLSMFLAPSTKVVTVSMTDVCKTVTSMLIDPSLVSNEKCLTFSGPTVCMNDVVEALSDVVGQRVEYMQVVSAEAYADSLTSKNSKSKFAVDALMELCQAITSATRGQSQSQSQTLGQSQSPEGDIMKILERNGHFHRLFTGQSQAQASLTSLQVAMQALPLHQSEQKRVLSTAQSMGMDIYQGRWCLKKFCNESKYQRRFICLDRTESAFCW